MSEEFRKVGLMEGSGEPEDEEIIAWFTAKGKHIPLKKGQSKTEALKEATADSSEKQPQDKAAVQRREQEDNGEKAVREKKPTISPDEAQKARAVLIKNGYPVSGYLGIIQKAEQRQKESAYGTFDLRTGKPIELTEGYCVSFQVNKAVNVRRDYTPEEYDNYVYECVLRGGAMPNIGSYGNPEISFCVKDKKIALQMMYDYNQASIYDVAGEGEIPNEKYNRAANPTEDDKK